MRKANLITAALTLSILCTSHGTSMAGCRNGYNCVGGYNGPYVLAYCCPPPGHWCYRKNYWNKWPCHANVVPCTDPCAWFGYSCYWQDASFPMNYGGGYMIRPAGPMLWLDSGQTANAEGRPQNEPPAHPSRMYDEPQPPAESPAPADNASVEAVPADQIPASIPRASYIKPAVFRR